jgi:CheY-like chemotaxis protein
LSDDAASPIEGTLLYIEDNEVNQVLVQEVLSQWQGLNLLVADDAAMGLRLARERAPDLILLDMHLPDMHGVQVLEQLRADTRTAGVPIISFSASAMKDEVAAALAAGAVAYWTKPLDALQFADDLRAMLHRDPAMPAPSPE